MRVVVLSDTHYLPQYRTLLEKTVTEVAALNPDCVIAAGDVGERLMGFDAMLALLSHVPCPRLILAGNHDLWARDGLSSQQLWEHELPRLTHGHGAIWLEGENWVNDGLGVCGTLAWYDYTGKDPAINMTDADYATNKAQIVMDGSLINWPWTDQAFAAQIGAAFTERLAALEADPAVREILVVTHAPIFMEAVVRKPGNYAWNVGNAYFYNLTLGPIVSASPKVSAVISAHTHERVTATVAGTHRPIELRVIPADYGKPAYVVIDYAPSLSQIEMRHVT